MAKCKYCDEDAGFLSNFHSDCEEKYLAGIYETKTLLRTAILGETDFSLTRRKIEVIAEDSFINHEKIKSITQQLLLESIDNALSDHLLTKDEEEIILSFMRYFGIEKEQIIDPYNKLGKAAILREVLEGKIPSRLKIEGTLPIVFEKNESIIWLIKNVIHFTEKTTTHFEGKHHGVSVRLVKGIYFRLGESKGYPVSETEKVNNGSGLLVITNKNVIFIGENRPLKLSYKKFLTVQPYDNGIGIHLSLKTAKPHFFQLNDVWYTYNLIYNLANLKL